VGTDRHPTCSPRVAAPQASCPVGPVLWSRLPRKPWSSYKPTGHAGRAMGEQRGFLKTRLNAFLSTSEATASRGVTITLETTHQTRIKIRAAPSAPEGLGPVWGPGACVHHKPRPPPLALGKWKVLSQLQPAGPRLPPHPQEWGAAQRPGQSSPHKTGSWCRQRGSAWVARDRQRGGASRQCTGRPQGPRPTPGPPPPADSLGPALRAKLTWNSQRPPDGPEPLPPLCPKESKWPGGWEVDPSARGDTLQG